MSNIVPLDQNKQLTYIQSVEKKQSSLSLRKKLAAEHGLTSISDFVDGWAVVRKGDKWMLINDKSQFLIDEDPTIAARLKVSIGAALDQQWDEEKKDYINTLHHEAPQVPVETTERIYPPKDGIIIVADNITSRHSTVRLYTTEGKRIVIPENWQFYNRFSKSSYQHHAFIKGVRWGYPHFSDVPGYTDSSGDQIDLRDALIHGMIPIQQNMGHPQYKENLEKYNLLHNECVCFLQKDGTLFQTETGQYYGAETGLAFPINGYLPCLDTKQTITDGRGFTKGVYYLVTPEGKAFKDEYNDIVYSQNAYRIYFQNRNGYSPITDYKDENKLYSIHKDGAYKKDSQGSKMQVELYPPYTINHEGEKKKSNIIPYHQVYQNLIRCFKKEISEADFYDALNNDNPYDKNIFEFYDYELNPIDAPLKEEKSPFDHGNGEPKIDHLDKDIVAVGYNAIGEDHHASTYYYGYQYLVNTRFNNKKIYFPDGRSVHMHPIDDYHDHYKLGDYNILLEENDTHENNMAILKINGLIARYVKDEFGEDMRNMHAIIPVFDQYIYIQREKNGSRIVVDTDMSYIKNNAGNVREFNYPPIRQNGVFLEYDNEEGDPCGIFGTKIEFRHAYFIDGEVVGSNYIETHEDNIGSQTKEILKTLQ